jgi:hypothetical protein
MIAAERKNQTVLLITSLLLARSRHLETIADVASFNKAVVRNLTRLNSPRMGE